MPCASRTPSRAAASRSSSATARCGSRATMSNDSDNRHTEPEMKTSTFARVLGIAYLLVGLMGLIPLFLVPPPIDAPPLNFTLLYGYLYGLFPVNLLHSLFHIVMGAWGISAWSGRSNPIRFCRDATILFGALAVLGMFPGLSTLFGIMPIHGHDVWLNGL